MMAIGNGNEARFGNGSGNDTKNKARIVSFRDLEVYRNSYGAMLIVMKEIIPKLPETEKYDLQDQMRRACKAIPRLIGEGYAKRHQKAGFQKYVDDAMGECNEMVVNLEQAKDIYPSYVSVKRCAELIDIYDKSARQLYKLGNAWTNFKNDSRNRNR